MRSNAKLLSSELATHLSGRSKEIALYPFSFKEFCVMKQVDTDRRTTKAEAFRRAAFDDYLKQGGLYAHWYSEIFPKEQTPGSSGESLYHL